MFNEIIEYLKCKSMDEIIEACNDIYEYRYITGVLKQKSIIRKMSLETNFGVRDLCDCIETYASQTLFYAVKLLMIEKPYCFIDTRM